MVLSKEERVLLEVARVRCGITNAAADAAVARSRSDRMSLPDALVATEALSADAVASLRRTLRALSFLCAKCGTIDYRSPDAPLVQGEFCDACRGAGGKGPSTPGSSRFASLSARAPEGKTPTGRFVPVLPGPAAGRSSGVGATVRIEHRADRQALPARPAEPPPPEKRTPVPTTPQKHSKDGFADNVEEALGPARASSLRPRLVILGGTPVDLEVGTTFTLGRGPENTFVIPSSRISRRHAEIRWKGDRPILVDRGSVNGTFVNGKAVSEQELRSGDEIELGPFLFCTFKIERGASSSSEDVLETTQKIGGGQLLAGRIGPDVIAELLQSIELNRKTGKLEVSGPQGRGSVALKEGVPLTAEIGSLRDEEAILTILAMAAGRFVFTPSIPVCERRVKATITALLLEAGRRRDEATHVDE